MDQDFLTLEKDPTERETLARVFRTIHTVKGTAGFLGLDKLQGVAHAGENLLSRLRDGAFVFNAQIASVLLATVDAIRQMLSAVEKTERDGDGDYSGLIHNLEQLTENKPLASEPVVPLTTPAVAGLRITDSLEPAPLPPVPTLVSPVATPVAPVTSPTPPVFPPVSSVPIPVAPTIADEGEPTTKPVPPPITPLGTSTKNPPNQFTFPTVGNSQSLVSSKLPEPPTSEPSEPRASTVSDSAIRVDVGLLDKLMTLVGELVLARNQIMQFSTSQEDAPFLGTVQRLNLLTTELQTSVMKTRMQPIGNIWTKFPRVVRDLALACGKQVRIEMEGQETELDKTIVEAIRDPLTHMVRNAVDHGIEAPNERIAAGKTAEGRLHLHAFHEGGKVIIEITDDGGGIDPHRVRDKAVQSKLITTEQADRLQSIVSWSTWSFCRASRRPTRSPSSPAAASAWTWCGPTSRRSAARSNIDSRPVRGTTVRMKIPLTLAIIPALTITSGGDRYAIPQVSLLELVRLEGEQAQRGIELIHGAPVYRLRGHLLPLVYLPQAIANVEPRAEGDRDQHRGVAGRRPAIRSGRGRHSRHRGNRRQAACKNKSRASAPSPERPSWAMEKLH